MVRLGVRAVRRAAADKSNAAVVSRADRLIRNMLEELTVPHAVQAAPIAPRIDNPAIDNPAMRKVAQLLAGDGFILEQVYKLNNVSDYAFARGDQVLVVSHEPGEHGDPVPRFFRWTSGQSNGTTLESLRRYAAGRARRRYEALIL